MGTLTNYLGVVAEIYFHAVVKHVKTTLPKAIIAVGFAVFYNAAINLINLFKSSVFHKTREDLTANATGTISNNWLILQVIVFATFELLDKITTRTSIGHNSIFKSTDLGLILITTVEKYHLISTFFNQFVNVFGL